MKDINENFGVLIAFLLPGFLLLYGLSFSFDEATKILEQHSKSESPTVGGFFYTTLASLSLGLLISALRWIVMDRLLLCSKLYWGIEVPKINYASLSDEHKYNAFKGAIDNYYKYYQYYANSLVAVWISYVAYLLHTDAIFSCILFVLVALLSITLFLGAKDSLSNFYKKSLDILGGL